ncbi:unnamed protein product [Rotaria sp. Silwood2]|nr:unnamed protein product [Rotaria sp. Silwood2]CAF4245161.1 unnamed protein product [Rotaria sp. Silwood2]CAF4278961.1 unnamed protein product [Rotaria sp. Silwood2]
MLSSKANEIANNENDKDSLHSYSYHVTQQRPRIYEIQGHTEAFVKVPGLTIPFHHTVPLLYKIQFEGSCYSGQSAWLYLRFMIDDYLLYVDKFVPNTNDRYQLFPEDTENNGIDYIGGFYWYTNAVAVTTCAFSSIVNLNPGVHVIDVGARGGYRNHSNFPVKVIGGILRVELINFKSQTNIGMTPMNVTTTHFSG